MPQEPVTGKIHSLESFGAADGPGVRFIVFMHGCGFRCAYCHNPDTWARPPALEMTAEEVRQLRYVNSCNAVTDYGMPTLDEFLEIYKNRCLINLDHAWDFFPVLVKAVRRHGMEDQILLKAPAKVEYAKVLEELAPDMMFMPIYKEEDTLTAQLEQMNINFVGAELVFAKDDSPLAQDDYIRSHKKAGRLLWCNAILYNCKKPLSGGHTDDVAVTGDPDSGWGWIVDKGFDIIQTDWVMPLKCDLQNR